MRPPNRILVLQAAEKMHGNFTVSELARELRGTRLVRNQLRYHLETLVGDGELGRLTIGRQVRYSRNRVTKPEGAVNFNLLKACLETLERGGCWYNSMSTEQKAQMICVLYAANEQKGPWINMKEVADGGY